MEEDEKYKRDIEYLDLAIDTLRSLHQIDAPGALKQVKKKIKNKKRMHLFSRIQQVAAVLMLPFLLATLYYITLDKPVQYVKLHTNPGVVTEIALPDGTTVWLNSDTYFKYPLTFTGDCREVYLDGEAYFAVKKDKSKRFLVNTPFQLKAEVLGTEFNIDAYGKNRELTATLVSGSLQLSFLNNDDKEEIHLLKPNEQLVYNGKQKKTQTHTPYIPALTAWKDRIVIFRNTSFEDALAILEKQFNVDFDVKNMGLYNYSFTGKFDGQHLSLILEHFRISSSIQYKYNVPEKSSEKDFLPKTVIELY